MGLLGAAASFELPELPRTWEVDSIKRKSVCRTHIVIYC